MAGFPCSALLALYLTAIIILEGAVLSVERKGTQNATVPGSNVSLAALAETSRKHRSENGQSQDQVKDDNGHGCPNCRNKNDDEDDLSEDSELYKFRIEMIKAKILAKLQLDRAPVLKKKPNESKIAELLANLNLIGEDDEENQPQDFEEEYYGRTTKIIVFSEKGRRCNLVRSNVIMSELLSSDIVYRGHALVLSFVIHVFLAVFGKVGWSRGQQLKYFCIFLANSRAS